MKADLFRLTSSRAVKGSLAAADKQQKAFMPAVERVKLERTFQSTAGGLRDEQKLSFFTTRLLWDCLHRQILSVFMLVTTETASAR